MIRREGLPINRDEMDLLERIHSFDVFLFLFF